MRNLLIRSLPILSAAIFFLDVGTANAQFRTPTQIAIDACYECKSFIAENFDEQRDCPSAVAAKELLTCIKQCDLADLDAAVLALQAQAQACLDILKGKPGIGGFDAHSSQDPDFGRTSR